MNKNSIIVLVSVLAIFFCLTSISYAKQAKKQVTISSEPGQDEFACVNTEIATMMDICIYSKAVVTNEKFTIKATDSSGRPVHVKRYFDNFCAYKINPDGTARQLISSIVIKKNKVTFYNHNIETFGNNLKTYLRIMADVKSNIPDEVTLNFSLVGNKKNIIFTNNNGKQIPRRKISVVKTPGNNVHLMYHGSVNITIEPENNDSYIVAGECMQYKIGIQSKAESGHIYYLPIRNIGTALSADISKVSVYSDSSRNTKIGEYVFSDYRPSYTSIFIDSDIRFNTHYPTHIYLDVMVNKIDYSAYPGILSTGTTGRTIDLTVSNESDLTFRVEAFGDCSGAMMDVSVEKQSDSTNMITGAGISHIFVNNDERNLYYGEQAVIEYSVTGNTQSIDVNGSTLCANQKSMTISYETNSDSLTLENFKIRKEGGSNHSIVGEMNNNTMTIDLIATFGNSTDNNIGNETIKYQISSTIFGWNRINPFIQFTVEDLSFTHNTGYNGIDGPNAQEMNYELNMSASILSQ